MITSLLALLLVPLFVIGGGGLGTLLYLKMPVKKQSSVLVLYSFSLVSFYFLLSISSVWSFGVFGSDYFLMIMIAIIFTTYAFLVKRFQITTIFQIWKSATKKDFLTVIFLGTLCLWLSSNFFENINNVKIATGAGPDISQNLMAIASQRDYANTYSETRDNFFGSTGASEHFDAFTKLFQLPSMREVALIDYLVYGTRWGLTIPLAQVLRLNSSLIVDFQAVTLTVGLFGAALVSLGLLKYLFLETKKALVVTCTTISSSSLLFIFFNGGMAQIFALAGVFGITYSLIVLSKESSEDNFVMYVLFLMSSCFVLVTYAESFIVLAFWLLVFLVLKIVKTNERGIPNLGKLLRITGALVFIFSPYIYAFVPSVQIRAKGSLGTGFNFNPLPFPSEMIGIMNVWTFQYTNLTRTQLHWITSATLSLLLLILLANNLIRNKFDDLNKLFVAFLVIIILISLNSYLQDARTNYAYVKTFSYFTPFIVYYLFKSRFFKQKDIIMHRTLPAIIALAVLVSTSSYLNKIKDSEVAMFSHKIVEIINDKEAVKELEDFNYLTVYRPIANMIGVIADFHWIARAPNVVNLSGRMNKDLRVICLKGDSECKNQLIKIPNSSLDKYGFDVFESTINSLEFSKLSPKQRYEKVYEITGQAPLDLPKSFIGGNPILDK